DEEPTFMGGWTPPAAATPPAGRPFPPWGSPAAARRGLNPPGAIPCSVAPAPPVPDELDERGAHPPNGLPPIAIPAGPPSGEPNLPPMGPPGPPGPPSPGI